MPVYFDQEAGDGRAVWRSEDGAEEVALCSVDLTAYSNEPSVRERFSELVSAVADYYRRTHVAAPVAFDFEAGRVAVRNLQSAGSG